MPAFIGDVHGRPDKLAAVLDRLRDYDDPIVLLGDYVDFGPDSKGVLDLLVAAKVALGARFVALEGNHDSAFRDFLEGGALGSFLAIGGGSTVRSYVESPCADVSEQLRGAVPQAHLDFLRGLRDQWESAGVLAVHRWPERPIERGERLVVLGHYLQPASTPKVTAIEVYLDTGCGVNDDGTLTCFLFPEREWFAV
jgi:hypothetical protein